MERAFRRTIWPASPVCSTPTDGVRRPFPMRSMGRPQRRSSHVLGGNPDSAVVIPGKGPVLHLMLRSRCCLPRIACIADRTGRRSLRRAAELVSVGEHSARSPACGDQSEASFSRPLWCRGRDSNSHDSFLSADFKSAASTIPPPRLEGMIAVGSVVADRLVGWWFSTASSSASWPSPWCRPFTRSR